MAEKVYGYSEETVEKWTDPKTKETFKVGQKVYITYPTLNCISEKIIGILYFDKKNNSISPYFLTKEKGITEGCPWSGSHMHQFLETAEKDQCYNGK